MPVDSRSTNTDSAIGYPAINYDAGAKPKPPSTTTTMTSLDSIPQEVLEHIAFYTATNDFLGPPSDLVPLITSSRRIYARLSTSANPYLYNRIFNHKFDLKPALRRLGEHVLSPAIITAELIQRSIHLKRLRARADVYQSGEEGSQDMLNQLLLRSYIWLLENEGKNERQLREFGKLDFWLHEYWFKFNGASGAMQLMHDNKWPIGNRSTTLAMWLYWLLVRADGHKPDDSALDLLGAFALAAHKYNITLSSWTEFLPTSSSHPSNAIAHFGQDMEITVLPVAIPAILSFLTLVNQPSSPSPLLHPLLDRNAVTRVKPSAEWDSEWARCQLLAQTEHDALLSEAFKPGSAEGVWEGQFTYTEFTAYAALLGGAPPHVLQKSVVARHHQTWKLREHHLEVSDISSSDSGVDLGMDSNVVPLPAGDPLRSFFPNGTHIKEDRDGITIHTPHRSGSIRYQRVPHLTPHSSKRKEIKKVADVIIMGEGHSSWGQFNLVGRVRPCDGLISLTKEYVDGDRGRWLYRGYLVGNAHGNLVGRWRDTLSPPDVPGYEGCFAMNRRR
ncbi:hypothetical protein NP233_g5270 [Leucocoprinus birnbaumii]|uniref:F-box domain-containing protein n=1 Tax=Leucocoprinus birnbaumii TaxID=56174 RepID=A0AAD5YS21_9AGAR|nr:hypothetical protein NP233_g5270 [Leucocoprinus birnbaumii]